MNDYYSIEDFAPYESDMASRGKPEGAAELLEKVTERFETGEWTWIQGALGNLTSGRACLVGGVLFATGDSGTRYNVNTQMAWDEQLAYKALYEAMGSPRKQISEWNDDRGRTKEQVINVLKHAAKDLRNQA